MSQLSSAMKAALDADEACVTGFLEVNLPDGDVFLFFGSGEIDWDGKTFLGEDPQFGVLAALDPPEDGFGDSVPGMSFTINPAGDAEAAALAAPDHQGSRVRFWVAAVDAVGGVVDSPFEMFDGVLDVPEIVADKGERTLEYECISEMEKLFANEEGRRLSHASHAEIWPGEDGLINVSGILKQRIWGPGELVGGNGVTTNAGGGGGGVGGDSTPARARALSENIIGDLL